MSEAERSIRMERFFLKKMFARDTFFSLQVKKSHLSENCRITRSISPTAQGGAHLYMG